MEAIEGGGYQAGIDRDVGRACRIPRIAEASIGGHYEKRKSNFGHYGHRSRQEFIIPVASPQPEVRHHSGHRAIEIIGEEFA